MYVFNEDLLNIWIYHIYSIAIYTPKYVLHVTVRDFLFALMLDKEVPSLSTGNASDYIRFMKGTAKLSIDASNKLYNSSRRSYANLYMFFLDE